VRLRHHQKVTRAYFQHTMKTKPALTDLVQHTGIFLLLGCLRTLRNISDEGHRPSNTFNLNSKTIYRGLQITANSIMLGDSPTGHYHGTGKPRLALLGYAYRNVDSLHKKMDDNGIRQEGVEIKVRKG
jgi:hypothetical protein